MLSELAPILHRKRNPDFRETIELVNHLTNKPSIHPANEKGNLQP
jgi:hypothetical protein